MTHGASRPKSVFLIVDAVRRVARGGEHVVPLQDLVQHDAIEKSAQAEPEENAGGDGKALFFVVVQVLQFSLPDGLSQWRHGYQPTMPNQAQCDRQDRHPKDSPPGKVAASM